MKYSVDWLKEETKKGNKHTLLGFWGDKTDNPMERVYSNFYLSDFTAVVVVDAEGNTEEVMFRCNEQYFMYRKALLFKDFDSVTKILSPDLNPFEYKKLGRAVQNYKDSIWNEYRFEAMKDGLFLKFTKDKKLKRLLLNTGNKVLVETSPFDEIWGIKMGKRDRSGKINKDWLDVYKWRGQNLLGFALMEVRDEINAL